MPSPDGSRIAFVAGHSIWVMPAGGGEASKIFSAGSGYRFDDLDWSADGSRLADMRRHGEYDEVVVESRAVTGGEAVVAISDPRLRSFAWAPNGHLFYSQLESLKEASANIWEVGIDSSTFQASGSPQKLTNWAGFSLWDLSTTSDGKRVSFVRKNDQSDVYVGELSANGSRFRMPVRLTQDDRMDWPGSWAQERNALLFFSDRNANFDIFEQAVDKPAPIEIVTGQSEEKRDPQLSPDGRWILYLAWPNQRDDQLRSSGRLMRVPVSGGAPEFVTDVNGYPGSARMPRERELPSARGYPDFRCTSIPISGRPCVLAEAKGDHLVFSAFDPLQGKQGEVASMEIDPIDSFWDLSRDGTRIALGRCEAADSHVRILQLATKQESQVRVPGWACLTSIAWSPDGNSLFASTWGSKGGSLLHIMPTGDTALLYRALGMSLERPIPSPDGHFLAYGEVTTISNAWMIESP
ncbi:MAG: hypothetical protein ACJ71Q_00970 [Terriglobales bacterium]